MGGIMQKVLFVVVLIGIIWEANVAMSQSKEYLEYRKGMQFNEFIKDACVQSGGKSRSGKKVVLFVEFLKFGCETCLNNFLDFCDTLNICRSPSGDPDVLLIFERDNQNLENQSRQMQSWIRSTGLH